MIKSTFFNFSQTLVIGGCALLVAFITSIIHHLVGKVTRWWSPGRAGLLFSVLIGGAVQSLFIQVLEPVHIVIMAGNILLIYLSAVGLNALIGKPVVVFAIPELEEIKALREQKENEDEKAPLKARRETWRTRWH